MVTEDDKILTAENPEKLQRHEAQRVEVTGDLNGNVLHVERQDNFLAGSMPRTSQA